MSGSIPQYPWKEGDPLFASALNAAFANGVAIGGPFLPLAGGIVSGVTRFEAAVNIGLTGANNLQLLGGAPGAAATLWTTAGNLNIAAQGAGAIVNVPGNKLRFGAQIESNNPTVALSGSTPMLPVANFGGNPAGTSTVTGYTTHNLVVMGANNDVASVPAGGINYLAIYGNLGNGWDGSREGIYVQLLASGTSPGSGGAGSGYLVPLGGLSIGDANLSGVSTGFGVSSHGYGNMFGANVGTRLTSNATFYHSAVGLEVDIENRSGSSVATEIGIQINHVAGHAVRGVEESYALRIADQTSATAQWRSLIQFGSYGSRWPASADSYLMQATGSGNATPDPTAAGGIDFRQVTFSGAGLEGGGFAFRWDGGEISPGASGGAVRVGYASLAGIASGAALDVTVKNMTAAAVASGGSGFAGNDLLTDANGNVVRVTTATAGVVSAVTIVKSGWSAAPPANPVAFSARSYNGVGGYGSGLTLNLTWTPRTALAIQPTAGGLLGFNGAAPIAKQTGVAVTIAAVHAALTNLGLIAP